MRLLVKHENVMAKLREEIKTTVGVGDGARNPNKDDIKRMWYLSYVVKKGMHPMGRSPSNTSTHAILTKLDTSSTPLPTRPRQANIVP